MAYTAADHLYESQRLQHTLACILEQEQMKHWNMHFCPVVWEQFMILCITTAPGSELFISVYGEVRSHS